MGSTGLAFGVHGGGGVMRVQAPAKINWFLEITGKRRDGYHTLATLFQTISLGDELVFEPADDLQLTCSNPELPMDENNLVYRAAARLRETLNEKRGVRIHLRKVVPMGAGLGGGSSDAAAVLRALPKLWKRRVPAVVLHRIAKTLGADVPFFLEGGLCAATGIGDMLKPMKPRPRQWLVLVYPGFGVATKEAYAKIRLPFANPQRLSTRVLFNRFEDFVFPDHPELPALKRRLLESGASGALMSGSGSSLFGLVPSRKAGEHLLQGLQSEYPQSWLVHTL